jgi:hypothetical protein
MLFIWKAAGGFHDAMTIQGFISYAHEDEAMCRELQKQLKPLERAGKARFWADHGIGPGDDWHAEILKALDAAKVALFLVSPDMMCSKFIFDVELLLAAGRQKNDDFILIPVILRPCIWDFRYEGYNLADYQAVPEFGRPITQYRNRDAGYHDAAARIMGQISKRFGV